MRRWVPILTLLVAIVFGALAMPKSPVAEWLVDVLAGGNWRGLSEGERPDRAAPPPDVPVLRAAVGAMVTPERTYSDYRELFRLVAEETGRRLELVQRRTYSEVNDLLVAGEVDMAWVCTGAIEDLDARKAVRLLAVPVIGGRTDYQSYVIARSNSTIAEFEDLRGTVFAFTDPLSLTGRRVVVDLLQRRGQTVDDFFSDTFFTHAHDNSIRAVQDGIADSACVDSLVYDYMKRSGSDDGVSGTRVVWRSERFPIPPLVTPVSLDDELFTELQRLLLQLGEHPGAQTHLVHLRLDAFVRGDPGVYFSQ
ncbi:MAG: PhnD/SsuA/transferrin family substrate-binding protein [bacterium]|nr:PhnD/SsuA/transferrin family substrate-binding protein [bacterium]